MRGIRKRIKVRSNKNPIPSCNERTKDTNSMQRSSLVSKLKHKLKQKKHFVPGGERTNGQGIGLFASFGSNFHR